MTSAITTDLLSVMNRPRFSRFQIGMIALCALVEAIDGFDTQSIGFIGPALLKEFHVTRAALGPVFSAGLLGLLVGAVLISPIADRFGRKFAIILSVLIIGVFTIFAARSASLQELMIWRFLAGIGLGGAIPPALTMTSEYAPEARRGSIVMLVALANPVGASLGAFLSAELITAFGWRSVLWLGAVLPFVLALLLYVVLRESPRWLALQKDAAAKLRGIVGRMAPDFPNWQNTTFTLADTQERGVPVRKLFSDGRALGTVLLWIVFFMAFVDLFVLSQWLPTLMSSAGASQRQAVASTALFQIGGIVGGLALGRLVDKRGSQALCGTFVAMAAFIIVTGLVSGNIFAVLASIFCSGFFLIASVTGVVGYTTAFYPTSARSTGLGWASAVGRGGSIVGPLLTAGLLAENWSNQAVFMACAIPALIAALMMALLPKKNAAPTALVPAVATPT